jgi:hypothetical protein
MAPPAAGANQLVHPYCIFKHKEFTIILPNALASAYPFLAKQQKDAIDKGAVYKVVQDTRVELLGWTSESPPRACTHVNLRGTTIAKLQYAPSCHIALFLKRGLVVAGIFLLDLGTAWQIGTDGSSVELFHESYAAFLEK